jgi:hypothetical protein
VRKIADVLPLVDVYEMTMLCLSGFSERILKLLSSLIDWNAGFPSPVEKFK